MKKETKPIVITIAVVLFALFAIYFWPLVPIPPKPPEPVPIVQPVSPVGASVPVKIEKPYILAVEKVMYGCPEKSIWIIKLNRLALHGVKNRTIEIRLHVGYCWYNELRKIQKGGKILLDSAGITPEWHPKGRVSVGLWDTKTKKYLSSVIVRKGV